MDWPAAQELTQFVVLPDGYRTEQLKRTEILALIEAIKLWHPDIGVGAASCYLREDFYTEKILLDGEVEKDVIVLLIKYGDELAAMGSWEREQDALTLYARFGAVAPAHRGAKLAVRAMELGEGMGRTMGAGYCLRHGNTENPLHATRARTRGVPAPWYCPGLRSGACGTGNSETCI